MTKAADCDSKQEPLTFLDVVTFWLSVYVLVELVVEASVKLSPDTLTILGYADWMVCVVFFIDFCRRFFKAPSKLGFMKWGWLDLLACVPMIDAFRAGRVYRLVRVIRIMRAIRSSRHIVGMVYRRRAQNTFAVVATTSFVGTIFSAILMLELERDADGVNIREPIEAIWWSFCTVTTVGYGDYYPVTTPGRIVAVVLMTLGVGLFGTFAGYVGSLFVAPASQPKLQSMEAMEDKMTRLQASVDRLEDLLRSRGEGDA